MAKKQIKEIIVEKESNKNGLIVIITSIICMAILGITALIGVFWGKEGLINTGIFIFIGICIAIITIPIINNY